jgi:DNA-binding response OmpR family regulator
MSAEPRTVLVVDDDRLVQTTFKLLLEQKGFRVVVADDGNHGLEQLEKHTPDIVLLDILMPDKEGIETLIEMKRRFAALPVIVMSGGGTRTKQDFLALARKFGADAVIKKNQGVQEMIALVDSHSRHLAA